MALRTQRGILSKDDAKVATCFVDLDLGGAYHLSDSDVMPPLPDGEYSLNVFDRCFKAARHNGIWKELERSP